VAGGSSRHSRIDRVTVNGSTSKEVVMNDNVIARKLDLLEEKAAMRSVDVANVLESRPETVSRWKQGKAFPRSDTQRTLFDLYYIVEQLADFYTPKEARVWLYSRQKLLRGEIPADLIREGKATEVIAVIDQLRDSIHV
jgi:Protein of unknown function (DUF2384)